MINPQKIFGRLGNSMFQYAYIYAQARKGVIPDIYVQDPVYFDEYRDEIRQLFAIKQEPLDMVAIHVRHGANPINVDEPKYCENPFYVNLMDTDYYEKAMMLFPDSDFLIFSDDIEWCKEQSLFAGCEFSEGLNELDDMNLMANCKGIIMANSSFSWWGAYLSNAKVVAPIEWYKDTQERTKLLPEWIRI
jgi:hypothetical protein